MKNVFRNPWFHAALGIVLCGLIVWFGGPWLGFGDSQPLAGVAARIGVIVFVAVVWLGVLALRHALARRRARRMEQELASQADPVRTDADARAHAEREALRKRFAEALALLRKRRDGGGTLEDLPWYLVIGAPGSGKSTLLEHSGFDFPLMQGTGKRSVGGIGGTRHCDWWFTDQAVFLDTAGRYATQDSDPLADAKAWDAFLDLLRRHRRRRPVNGVLLTMSVAELLAMDDPERDRHARTLRERLDEIGTRLGIAVPVYLVLTKVDLASGFGEFFDALDPSSRSQVWGMTFDASQSVDGSAPSRFGAEFDALLERVDARLIERMHAERDVRRRTRILSFPQQLRALRDATQPLVGGVFARHAYGRSPVLRGVYLTSGTQEGTPIDRVLSVVGRAFGVRPGVPAAERTPRRTYFVERLFRETILPEAGFVGADPGALRRRRVLEAAAIAGVGTLTAALLVGMATSYGRNADFIARVDQVLRDFPGEPGQPAALRPYYAQALQRLDVLARADQAAAGVRDERPLSMRFGLFQGDAVEAQVRGAYEREINASVIPGLSMQFRDGLRASADEPQRLYDVLKGYLMLGEPEHRDVDELVLLAAERWREVFPNEDALVDALQGHFRVLFESGDHLRALPMDASLVDAARASLRAADLATLIYGGLKLTAETRQDAAVRLDRTLGLLGDVFRRRSGAPLSRPLPALYTRPVFAEMVSDAPVSGIGNGGGIAAAVSRFVKEDWVFGAKADDPLRRASLAAQVRTLYAADYIRAWDDLIGDLALQPVANVQQASGVASRLSGPGSPLKALLMLIRDNTTDLLRQNAPDVGDRVAANAEKRAIDDVKRRSEVARIVAEAAGPTTKRPSTDRPDAPIVEHFAPINQLTDGAPGATPLDRVLASLDQVSKALLAQRPGTDGPGQGDPSLLSARQETAQLPAPFSDWLGGLVGSSQSLVDKDASGALNDGFRQAAGNDCAMVVQGRYPFTAGSRNDVPLQDFSRLFGPGGRFDAFFRQTLAKSVDTGGANWTFRDGAHGSATLLAQAQLADTIRQVWFRDGPQPDVAFTLSIGTPPSGIGRLTVEVDGQSFEYKAGDASAPMPMHWPGPKPGLTRISAWDTEGKALPVLEYPGEWGLFHALDAASLQRRTETRFGAGFDFGTVHAAIDVEAASLRNPFGDTSVHRFRCPA
ncbi:type VI secretion system membrane subunit TssM [Luteibacter aegosomatis]|uniref:type VI secretion system membrane subunit TssM n=1 Tax=Luteibacter aegosomatis TaxID=2911537 RepID=UPI001FFB26E0|nr:type VI secretion system membrane subunit TssM [Luteibacter aegosomatis]UPG84789.1 type VI secretion system membrane subunit TssM [Luteibacter aegosomatis]